ncbi:GTPase [Photobacterium sanguinicancri]|uniref:GTPase n=1 Tax=Photobacterium sanguinicancri TaxID=875932 RepID=UPI000AF45E22|nr:GTPase [Photobacterium sanguinicancri]
MRNPFIDIKQNLLDSKERVINYQGSDLANQIHDELNKKVDDQVLQIMLYGAYNAGKSTFVNALIGEERANVGEIPTTDSVDIFDWNATAC